MPAARSCTPTAPGRGCLCPREFRDFIAAAEFCGFDGVEHQHGDGEWADAAWNGRQCACDLGDFWMNVAHQGGAFLAEGFFALGVAGEETLELRGIGDGVHPDIDHGGAGFDEVAGDHSGAPDGGHQNVGAAADSGQVVRFRVANGSVALALSSSMAAGLPTMSLRPTTTEF